ncbi:nuclear transport factor 2 family protein [Rhodococcus sp. HNM0569]|uniref:nuclear transport factor 2 family protein n=1 Tax=Rhodococcus sp. HNM0569 TaxID=2716340 RepID=UPI00146E798A|nr:nuclear transport factor 2 family protein [Rhodococcus sp. HNM0569]NLU81667.1 nuclear transport factor 2 family protein [Rhodococcus sp. HNM0569]
MPFPIAELSARYAQAVDRRDRDALAALFAPDVTFTLPPALTGGDASTITGAREVADAVVGAVSHLIATRHVVHQQVVDGLTGELYCTAHHLYRREDSVRDNRIALRYADRYVAFGDGWVFASRSLTVDFSEDVPVRVP